jgi:hypothetical protein
VNSAEGYVVKQERPSGNRGGKKVPTYIDLCSDEPLGAQLLDKEVLSNVSADIKKYIPALLQKIKCKSPKTRYLEHPDVTAAAEWVVLYTLA